MRLDELPTSDRVEDRRGLPGGRAGIGIGTIAVLTLIGWALGIDPRVLIGGAEMISGGSQLRSAYLGGPRLAENVALLTCRPPPGPSAKAFFGVQSIAR
jgi:hypothetical protein